MANRFINPNDQYLDATPTVYSGGKLHFYLTGTSDDTSIFTYNSASLAVANPNPVILDSAGRPTQEIFLDPAVTYKVTLSDSNDVLIWSRDPVVDPATNVTATFQIYAGNPNGNKAGNAGTVGGSGASVIWDIVSNILWVCTFTGGASGVPLAIWTQVASQLSGAIVFSSVTTPTALSASVNDYSPASLATTSILRQDSSADWNITGLATGASGRIMRFCNISIFNITLLNESTASTTAANRFHLDGDYVVAPNQTIDLWYDGTILRWRLVGLNNFEGQPGGRLTLSSGVPVLQSDTTAAVTLWYTPYKHNYVRLYNGLNWYTVQFSNISQNLSDGTKSPSAAVVSQIYDAFLWNDAGTLTLSRGPTWASGAVAGSLVARGTGAGSTEIERVDGIYVNKNDITNGPAAQRGLYLGTIQTSATGANGQMNMMFFPAAAAAGPAARLDVWNMYNRVRTSSTARDSNNSWAYTVATLRNSDNSANNSVAFCVGLNEDPWDVMVNALTSNTTAGIDRCCSIGLDGVVSIGLPGIMSGAISHVVNGRATYSGLSGIGVHFFAALEYSVASGVSTWYGDNNAGSNIYQSGITVSGMM